MKQSGLTVTELLIVIVIIALLVALMLPVVFEARKRAQRSPCMANMRQIYVGWSGYLQDYGEQLPSLPALVERVRSVFACPADPYPEGANSRVKRLTGVRGSYFYLSDTVLPLHNDRFVHDLQEADSNHGILACVLHGNRASEVSSSAFSAYKGIVLRLRRDGSIQIARQTAYCTREGGRGRCLWDLMTDVRDHPARSRWCTQEGEAAPCE